MAGRNRFLEPLRALSAGLEEAEQPYTFIGGIAVIARGVARYTADIDASVVATRGLDVSALLRLLRRHGITPRIKGAEQFARANHVLLLQHVATGIALDLALAYLPFEEEAVRHSERVDYAGVPIRVPRAEDLVIFKLVANRPKDLDDVRELLALYGTKLDLSRVRLVLGEFCAVLEDDERLRNFDALLAARPRKRRPGKRRTRA